MLPNIGGPQEWTSPQGLASTLQVMLLLTVISLAPAILLMTTSFVRIIVVLRPVAASARHAATAAQPGDHVDRPLHDGAVDDARVEASRTTKGIKPYTESKIGLEEAFDRGSEPLRRFMADQIVATQNDDDVHRGIPGWVNQYRPAHRRGPHPVCHRVWTGRRAPLALAHDRRASLQRPGQPGPEPELRRVAVVPVNHDHMVSVGEQWPYWDNIKAQFETRADILSVLSVPVPRSSRPTRSNCPAPTPGLPRLASHSPIRPTPPISRSPIGRCAWPGPPA